MLECYDLDEIIGVKFFWGQYFCILQVFVKDRGKECVESYYGVKLGIYRFNRGFV